MLKQPIDSVFREIEYARLAQETLREDGRFSHTCSDLDMPIQDCLIVLLREVGEVPQEVPCLKAKQSNHGHGNVANANAYALMKAECVQVAAVAVAIVEKLNRIQNGG
jgi:hypothetical protein